MPYKIISVVKLRKIIFLTGNPGIGKTTVLMKTVEELKKKGFSVGGIISREVREDGLRVGFKIFDLYTGKEGWLAHVKQVAGPTIGKYKVCLADLESIGAKAILNASTKASIVVIDEVGPMELFSQSFKDAIRAALKSDKRIIGIIHYKASDPIIAEIKKRGDSEVIEVSLHNRETLPELIVRDISESLSKN